MDEDYDLFENLEEKLGVNVPPSSKTPEEQVLDLIVETCKNSGGSILFDSVAKQIKDILKLGALHTKRRDALLGLGVKAGRFIVEWPKISLPPEPIMEISSEIEQDLPKDEFEPDLEEVPLKVKHVVKSTWTPPEGWTGPKILDCGHSAMWWSPVMTAIINEKGKRSEIPTEELACQMCLRKYPANPSDRRGEYANQPIPINFRSTAKSLSEHGWSGYCCDEDGIYIGGRGNNCQYTRKDEAFSKFDDDGNRVLCVAHQELKKK